MYDHAAIVRQHPTGFWITLNSGADIMLRTQLSLNSTRQGIQHAVAGTGTNYKIIRDGGNFADIQQ